MANTPCKALEKIFGINAYETASKINGWDTFLWINKNAVDETRIRKAGDFISPIDGLGLILSAAGKYDQKFNSNILIDLRKELLGEAKIIADPIIKNIVSGNGYDISEYKKAAQGLGKDIKEIETLLDDNPNRAKKDIVDASVYYLASVVESYTKSYKDMDKTIKQYSRLVDDGVAPYKHYISIEAKNILLGAFENMGEMFSSPNDLKTFIEHAAKQDFLRFLEKFNHKPLVGISDLTTPESIKASMDKFYSIFAPTGISRVPENEYKNLIRSMNGEYNPVEILGGKEIKKKLTVVYQTLADFRRFANATLNLGLAVPLTFGSMVGYTVKAVGDYGHGLYDTKGMDELLDMLGIEKGNIRGMSTRADINDVVSAGWGSGELSQVNRFAKWLSKKTATGLENIGVSEFLSTGIGEGAGEALKGIHNAVDTASKYQILTSALLHALRYFQFADKQTFMNFFMYTKDKEAWTQAIKEKMEDYIQFSSGFHGPSSWNISTFMRGSFTQLMMYLSTRGINMTKNFTNTIYGSTVGRIIDGMSSRIGGRKLIKPREESVSQSLLKNPQISSFWNYMKWTMFMGHKIHEATHKDKVDEDGNPIKQSPLEIALESFGKFGRWSNNYLQAIESNWIGRIALGVAGSMSNEYIKPNDKLLAASEAAFSSVARDFLAKFKGTQLVEDLAVAAARGVLNDSDLGLREELSNSWDKSTRGFNRYYIDQVESTMDSKNVPISQRDGLSMLFGTHINDIAEMRNLIKESKSVEKSKDYTLDWMQQQFLYNNVFGKMISSFSDKSEDMKREKHAMGLLYKKLDELGISEYVSNGIIPEGSIAFEDETTQKEWNSEIVRTLKNMGMYGGSKDQTLSQLFSDAGIRNQEGVEHAYAYNEYKTIADKYLVSQMSDKDFRAIEKLYNKDMPGQKNRLVDLQLLAYVEYNSPGAGPIVLSSMAYKDGEAFLRNRLGKKYVSGDDVSVDLIDAKNEFIAKKYGKLINAVSLYDYTKLMTKYIGMQPEFKDVRGILNNNGTMSNNLKNTYKAWITTSSFIKDGKGPEDIYVGTEILGYIKNIKDEGWKMNTILMILDQIDESPQWDGDVGMALKARVLEDAHSLIYKASKDDVFFKEHEDEIKGLMIHNLSTYDKLQKAMDDEFMEVGANQ